MSRFAMDLPTDISWERICVTEDMMDSPVCDERLPGKWRSSIAVFKYSPPEEYQHFDRYDISYLKVTATITGYQPLDKEIQGTINWDDVNVAAIPGLTDLLTAYNPCHGAIVQVAVGPDQDSEVPLEDYPFFLDFEPKKRELYELATDTREKQSRSVQSLNVTRSAGATQSVEVLDVDMGGSTGFGLSATDPTGMSGSLDISSSSQGQWGTKRLNADESMAARTSDVAQEKRETFAFTTQLAQMYHLLDSYHPGTNRAVFFLQPRPHVIEEPSGFVRGPRPVEGIQEFFLIVARPKGQDAYRVSVRLDTSHLTTSPILDYERKSDVPMMASATAPIPTDKDTMGDLEKWGEACFLWECWDMYYQCYLTRDEDDVVYQAPDGYVIDSYVNLVNSSSHGSTSVSVSGDRKALAIHAEANGKICFEDTFGCVDCPDEWQKWSGSARRQVQVNLVSTEPTRKIGEEQALMITTRGLCCSERSGSLPGMWDGSDFIVGVARIPKRFQGNQPQPEAAAIMEDRVGTAVEEARAVAKDPDEPCGCSEEAADDGPKLTVRQANELSDYIRAETLRGVSNPNLKPRRFMETDFFARQMELGLVGIRQGRKLLADDVSAELDQELVGEVQKHLRRRGETLSRRDVLSLRPEKLSRIAGVSDEEARRLRLELLGIPVGNAKEELGR